MIEIVGFRNVLHGLVLLAPNGHGTRLAQVGCQAIVAAFHHSDLSFPHLMDLSTF